MTPGQGELAGEDLRLAEDALRAAKILLDAGIRSDAASRLYYAVFHATRAALTVRGLSARTHSGQIGLHEQTFGSTPILGKLLELRAEADYGKRVIPHSVDQIRGLAVEAESLVEKCRRVVVEALENGSDEPDPPPDV